MWFLHAGHRPVVLYVVVSLSTTGGQRKTVFIRLRSSNLVHIYPMSIPYQGQSYMDNSKGTKQDSNNTNN